MPGRSPLGAWGELAELEGVRIFAVVAELRSFRRAAAALLVPSSTVSRRIAELEAALETRLLQRTTRQVHLTDAGEAFLSRITPALAAIADAGRAVLDAQAQPRGLLRVSTSAGLGETVAAILFELQERHPELRLEFDCSDRQIDLVAEGFDIAIRAGALADSSLMARSLGHAAHGYFASPAYLKRRGRPKLPSDLAEHECVVYVGRTRGAKWQFQRGRRLIDMVVRRHVVANSLAVVRLGALRGLGVAWLPEPVTRDDVKARRLVPVLRAHWPAPIPVQLLYPSSRHLAPQVRAAIELLHERLRFTP